MPKQRAISTVCSLAMVAAAAALSGCANTETALQQQPAPAMAASAPDPEITGSTSAPLPAASTVAAAPAAPMTRERASTDCWMRYEGRGLSLDQRLPLVEKCTAEKLKAQPAR